MNFEDEYKENLEDGDISEVPPDNNNNSNREDPSSGVPCG